MKMIANTIGFLIMFTALFIVSFLELGYMGLLIVFFLFGLLLFTI